MNNFWLHILPSISIGAIFAALISAWITTSFQKKKLIFETKLSKYANLIQAYQDAVPTNSKVTSEAARQNFVSNQKQVELISTDEIIQLSQKFYVTDSKDGPSIRDKLVNEMRKNLKKYYS